MVRLLENVIYSDGICHFCVAERHGPDTPMEWYGEQIRKHFGQYVDLLVRSTGMDLRTAKAEAKRRLSISRWTGGGLTAPWPIGLRHTPGARAWTPLFDLHEHLIKVPPPGRKRAYSIRPLLADLSSEDRANPVPPEPDRLVAHLDPTLVKKVLDIA